MSKKIISPPTRWLGLDPGLAIVGWSILEGDSSGEPNLLDYGTIETDKQLATAERLVELERDLVELIAEFQPHQSAMEIPFFDRQIKAAGAVLQGVGVLNLVCYRQLGSIPVQLHQSSWKAHLGHGNYTKDEVAEILQHLFNLKTLPIDDSVDAIGIAYAAFCGVRNDIQ